MAQRTLTTTFEVFAAANELSEPLRELLQAAQQALSSAHNPYSNFFVGAAILLENGEVISGANQENASYPMCLCAERVVLAAAHAQYPNVPIKALAVTVKNPKQVISEPASPCGACRQVICEMEQRYNTDIQVVMRGEVGEIFLFQSAKDLLPFGFNESFLGEVKG